MFRGIVPAPRRATGAALLRAEWRGTEAPLRARGAVVVAGLGAAGAAVALLHPSLHGCHGVLVEPSLSADPVVVVDYADLRLDYVRDVVALPDVEKARCQTTRLSHELVAFLSVAGGHERTVVPLSTSLRLAAGTSALLVVMNGSEDRFVAGLPFQRRMVVESVRGGELARAYRVVR
jgi:hypothetical protein